MDNTRPVPAQVSDSHRATFEHALRRIAQTPIETDPFPHLYVRDLFPSDYYEALKTLIAAEGRFSRATYPGVGVDLEASSFRDYGMVCENMQSQPQLAALSTFVRSDGFARLLLDRFAAPDSWGDLGPAIPRNKHHYFAQGREDFTTVVDLHKDLAGYEITPHPDVPSKIVTFLLYLTPDSSLSEYGTFLCRPKRGVEPKELSGGRSVRKSLVSNSARWLTGTYGLGQRDQWYPWEQFDVVKTARAHPNTFLAFAPNQSSFHAVRMNIPRDSPVQERLTLRGFIRSGSNASNYRSSYSGGLGRRVAFRLARLFER